MQCPHCGYDHHKVIDSREREDAIRRRRQCTSCEQRFTTYEHIAPSLLVSKRDGHREPFDRQKLLAGIRVAAVKRPVSSERIECIANHVEDRIQRLGRAEVSSELIGNLVLDQLADVDQVAYIRFASVCLDFGDLSEIRSEIDRLMGRSGQEAEP
ncbi:MAG: transcriptional regulator NrdR [Caldilineaceae bacterium]|nr:transcriptional regulator NrdR [Caldilineaceae bacterium]MDE0181302.1 transcriptional regulator NrdR [Caldilineaceae bacterium]MDE0431730.1 transcriptional regulator NrdR [Caldilineaceae bacterium]